MYEEIVNKLIKKNKQISTMESCTGGALASAITNVSGSSEVFKFGAITYANEFKIKMGVNEEVIENYTVYSKEVAREMAKVISDFTSSDYGIGVTGHLGRIDPYNLNGNINEVFVCIYDKENNDYFDFKIKVKNDTRIKQKDEVLKFIYENLNKIL